MDEGSNKNLGKRRHESPSSTSSSSSTSSTSHPQDGHQTRRNWDWINDPEEGTSKAPDYGPNRPFVPPRAKRRKTEVQPHPQPQTPPIKPKRQRRYEDDKKCKLCEKEFATVSSCQRHLRTQVRKSKHEGLKKKVWPRTYATTVFFEFNFIG